MTDKKYEGYENWETWNIALWLTNDESVYNLVIETLKQKYAYESNRQDALKDLIYDLVHGNEDLGIIPYIKDDVSLWRVNLQEIIESFEVKNE